MQGSPIISHRMCIPFLGISHSTIPYPLLSLTLPFLRPKILFFCSAAQELFHYDMHISRTEKNPIKSLLQNSLFVYLTFTHPNYATIGKTIRANKQTLLRSAKKSLLQRQPQDHRPSPQITFLVWLPQIVSNGWDVCDRKFGDILGSWPTMSIVLSWALTSSLS